MNAAAMDRGGVVVVESRRNDNNTNYYAENPRDLQVPKSSTATATSTTVSMLDVWNSFSIGRWEQSSASRRETLGRFRRAQLKAGDVLAVCQNVYDAYVDACWSLVGRLDADACASTFKIPERKIHVLRDMFERLFDGLYRMQRACRRFGVESRFRLNDNASASSETDFSEKSDATAGSSANNDNHDDNDNDDYGLSRTTKDDDFKNDSSTDDPDRTCRTLLDIVQDVDEYLYSLCRIALLRANDARALADIDDPNNFASVNHVMNDEHMNYLCSRIEYTGRYTPKKRGSSGGGVDAAKNDVRHTLRGMFLVSLREGQSSNGKFSTWLDANDNLQKIVTRFVNRYFVPNHDDDFSGKSAAAANVDEQRKSDKFSVFVNVSMKMNTQHFRVIKRPSVSAEKANLPEKSSSCIGSDAASVRYVRRDEKRDRCEGVRRAHFCVVVNSSLGEACREKEINKKLT